MDDYALLRQFARDRSAAAEAAFSALVERHVGLVYSVAQRFVGDPHHAEDIAQAVFVLLANKAAQLRNHRALTSWLFQTTRLTANNFRRSETRRRRREQEAVMQSALDNEPSEPSHATWLKIAPVLDDAIARLREKDRQAILLRFYEGQSLRDVGLALGASPSAADKRIHRALEKLRLYLTRRGVASTTASLSATLTAHSASAAPIGLAQTISAVALTKGAVVSTSTLTLIKETLKVMTLTKKTTIAAGIAVLFLVPAITMTTIAVKKHRQIHSWQAEAEELGSIKWYQGIGRNAESITPYFNRHRPLTEIVPTKFNESFGYAFYPDIVYFNQPLKPLIAEAYVGWSQGSARMVFDVALPTNGFDYIITVPESYSKNVRTLGSASALGPFTNSLQKELARKFGIAAHSEIRNTDVLLLVPGKDGAKNFKVNPVSKPSNLPRYPHGGMNDVLFQGANISQGLANLLEGRLGIPVIDQTGLTNYYDFSLKWDGDFRLSPEARKESMKAALLDQLGLELVPTNMPLEMLVVSKAK